MRKTVTSCSVAEELDIEQELTEIEMKSEEDDHKAKVIRLYKSIQLLKEVISSKILKELKSCKKSCEDANTVIGEIHGDVKKS